MKTISIAISTIIVGFIITWIFCFKRIDSGYEGVRVKLYGAKRGVQDVSLVTGAVWYNPFTERIYQFPIHVNTVDYNSFSVNAKDGTAFTVDPTLTLKVKDLHSPAIFKKYRKPLKDIVLNTLSNYVRDAFRIEFNRYTTDSIMGNRESFENAVQKRLIEVLDKEGFVYEQLTSGIVYPDAITDAVNEKNKAVQEAIRVENELRVSEAQAKKLLVQARAEAEANRLRKESLTPLLIQQQFVEKWDGKSALYGQAPAFFKNTQ